MYLLQTIQTEKVYDLYMMYGVTCNKKVKESTLFKTCNNEFYFCIEVNDFMVNAKLCFIQYV